MERYARAKLTLPDLPSMFSGMGSLGTFEVIPWALVQDMKERGDLDLNEGIIDNIFIIAKKRRPRIKDLGGGRPL
jgi:hypothetical protein